MSHTHAVGGYGALFFVGVAYFWCVLVPVILGTLESMLGLNKARRKS